MENKVDILCKHFGLTNYTINDGVVDVNGDVSLYDMGLLEIPFKFGKVTGNFTCAHNKLTTLENCPNWVGGHFYCQSNKLVSIIGPDYVGGEFFMDTIKEGSKIMGMADIVEYSKTIHVITDYNNLIKLIKRKDSINKVLKSDV